MYQLKQPLSYEQQIQHLKSTHNLMIEDEESALNILKSINYYRLSAYGIGLKQTENKEKYLDGISIQTLYQLHQFDSKFKNDLFHIIEQIEIKLRTQIANLLALKYGSEGYMNPNYFLTKNTADGISVHTNIINHFQSECKRQKNAPFVKHHIANYDGHFPIWVAIELFSFGNLASLFSILMPEDQKTIADLYNTSPNHLCSWILSLVEIRNICAHYGRLYNMPLKQTPFLYKEHRRYRGTINKVFPILLIIRRMTLRNDTWDEFFYSVQKTINDFSPVINLTYLGLPDNWIEILSE